MIKKHVICVTDKIVNSLANKAPETVYETLLITATAQLTVFCKSSLIWLLEALLIDLNMSCNYCIPELYYLLF